MTKLDDVIRFLQDTESRFLNYCRDLGGEEDLVQQSWDNPLGEIRTAISRGSVFEKASAVYCDIEVDTPPVLKEQMNIKTSKMRALVLEIGIHPDNPQVPKSYIELRANMAGEVILAGGTDLFPYFPNPEDKALFADRMRSACDHHGLNYEQFRKVRADFFKSKFTNENVGYHAGVYFFQLPAEKLPYFQEMTDCYFDTYQEVVGKHKGTPFSRADKIHQQRLHGQWAQWIMVEDEGTLFGLKKGIPPEALLGAILPPIARF